MALTDNSGQQVGAHSRSTTIQFLSLYLLVLAFFILLVSISTPENIKSKAVMDSLNSTFASVRQPRIELTVFTSRAGRFIGADEFQDRIDGLFAASLGVEKVEIVAPGRSMRVVMDADALFLADTVEIREAQIPMVDRIIASLNGRPPGLRFDMEFVIGAELSGAPANCQPARPCKWHGRDRWPEKCWPGVRLRTQSRSAFGVARRTKLPCGFLSAPAKKRISFTKHWQET
jgi:hypothetical protein